MKLNYNSIYTVYSASHIKLYDFRGPQGGMKFKA